MIKTILDSLSIEDNSLILEKLLKKGYSKKDIFDFFKKDNRNYCFEAKDEMKFENDWVFYSCENKYSFEEWFSGIVKEVKNYRIFFIYQKGFRQISLPRKIVINITSCDGGIFVTTECDMDYAEEELKKYIGVPVYEIFCDSNEIITGNILGKVELTKHIAYENEYEAILISTKCITPDEKIRRVV